MFTITLNAIDASEIGILPEKGQMNGIYCVEHIISGFAEFGGPKGTTIDQTGRHT
jgi:hypothetical protein